MGEDYGEQGTWGLCVFLLVAPSPLCFHLCFHRSLHPDFFGACAPPQGSPLVEGVGVGGSSMPCLTWVIKNPGLLCALWGEWSLGCLFWGCTIASIRMKVSTKGGNMLLPVKWAYKAHFKRVICLVNCSGRVVRARTKVCGIVLSNAKSLVKWLLTTLSLPNGLLFF